MDKKEQQTDKRRSFLRTFLKILGITIGVVILLMILVIVAGPYLVPTSAVERAVSNATERDLGRPSRIGRFSMSLIGGANIVIDDLVIEEKPEYGERPFFKADKITLDARIMPLLADRIVVQELSVQNPQLSIVRGPDGRFNFEDVPERPERPEPDRPVEEPEPRGIRELPSFNLSNVAIVNGTIHVHDMIRQESAQVDDVEAILDADFDSRELIGRIHQAALSFTGFNASMQGQIAHEDGVSVVRDFTVDAVANITQIGQIVQAALPLTLQGMLEYNARAEGAVTALQTRSNLLLTDFEAAGEMLREPARIGRLESMQSALFNLQEMTARDISSELTSEDLGVRVSMTGFIEDLQNNGEMDLATEARIDLQRLMNFINAFMDEPTRAAGVLTASGTLAGSPANTLTATGNAEIEGLEIFSPEMPQPYTEERLSMNYAIRVIEQREVNVRELTVQSRLLTAKASGTLSAETADFKAEAESDLGALSTVMGAMGITPEDAEFGGRLTSRLNVQRVPEGVRGELDGNVADFTLSAPQLAERYTEEQISFSGGLLAGFVEGMFDSLTDTRFNVNSDLLRADATAEVRGFASDEPKLSARAVIESELEALTETMVAMGLIEADRRIRGGAVRATLWLGPEEEEDEAAAGVRAVDADEDKAARMMRQMIDAMTGYQARATLVGQEIEYDGVTINETTTEVALSRGVLRAESRSRVGEGSADVNLISRLAAEPPQHQLELSATNIFFRRSLIAALQDVIPMFHLPLGEYEGRGNAQARLATRGIASEELVAALNGEGSLSIPEGVRVTVPVLAAIPGLGPYTEMNFGTMQADFTVENGLADNRAEFLVQGLEMRLNGTTNLITEEIDYRLTLSGERLGRDLRRLLGRSGELPVGIGGTIDRPRARLVAPGLGPLDRLLR